MTGRSRLLLAVAALAVVGLAIAGLTWAKMYAPLTVTAVGPGRDMNGVGKDETQLHLIFHGRPGPKPWIAEAHVVVRNKGRLPVTIEGSPDIQDGVFPTGKDAGVGMWVQLIGLRTPPARDGQLTAGPLGAAKLPAHGQADVWLRIKGRCGPSMLGGSTTFSGLRLRYKYLGSFERTQLLDWPVAVELACG